MTDWFKQLELFEHSLKSLQNKRIFLSTGDFSKDLGLIDGRAEARAEQAEFLSSHGAKQEAMDALLQDLDRIPEARVVNLSTYLGIWRAGEKVQAMLGPSSVNVYGTDGSRGEVSKDSTGFAEDLRRKLWSQQVTPGFFELLVASTILVFRETGQTIQNVPVGWDTRDLFAAEGQPGLFQEAVVRGVKRCGATALRLGVTPIANTCYVLASLKDDYPGLVLAFNKTASHNPPSHDGLKSFVRGAGLYRKLTPAEEVAITARAFAAAVKSERLPKHEGQEDDLSSVARRAFRKVLQEPAHFGMKDNEIWRAAALIYDGSNGAASAESTRLLMETTLDAYSAEDTIVETIGCEPNGQNINDHCGAGEIEGLQDLSAEQLENDYKDLPLLQRVFDLGRQRSELGRQGRLVYGLATDGDSDRSYTCFYDPFKDSLRFIDGDSALHLQFCDGLEGQSVGVGDVVAFTIESSAGFIDSLIAYSSFDKGRLRLYGKKRSEQELSLVMTPVGDKWVLSTQPCLGGEATGHIIRPVTVNGETVHAGNGPLGLLATLAAMERRIGPVKGPRFEGVLDKIVRPFDAGHNLVLYCYFVERGRFYRDGPVWQVVARELKAILNKHAPGAERQLVAFKDDPNTYMLLLKKNDKTLASLHIRCSGTEAKIGLKASSTADADLDDLFEALAKDFYFVFAREMSDAGSWFFGAQKSILKALSGGAQTRAALRDCVADSESSEALRQSRFQHLWQALLKQGLIELRGDEALLTVRGERALSIFE